MANGSPPRAMARAALGAALVLKERIAPLTSPMFIIEGETFVFVVPALPAGRYPFLCSPHWANMRGALVVTAPGAPRP